MAKAQKTGIGISEIIGIADELTANATSAEERQRIKQERKRAKKEHQKHENLIDRALALTSWRNKQRKTERKTIWHVDEKPTIPDLPKDATIAYRLNDSKTGYTRLQVRVQVIGNDKVAKTTVASLGSHFDPELNHRPFIYTSNDQTREYDEGIIMGEAASKSYEPLTPVDSSSEDFAVVERAISIIETGEQKLHERSRVAAGHILSGY